jgi:hypothetical protein
VCVKGEIERHKPPTDQIRQRYALCDIILQTPYICQHYILMSQSTRGEGQRRQFAANTTIPKEYPPVAICEELGQ